MKCNFCENEGAFEVEFHPIEQDSLVKLRKPFVCGDCFMRMQEIAKNLNERAVNTDEIQDQRHPLQKVRATHSFSKSSSLEQRDDICPFCGHLQGLPIP